jgi:signal transduction histidine kinase
MKTGLQAHAGRLEILDNPDRGVTFRIVLPYD